MPSYKTVKKRAHDEFTEKRSRFIGYVCPVQTVEEANGFISEIKQKHWDAKHNVYAYILRDGNIKKYSDDGEPQGAFLVTVDACLLLCAGVAYGAVTTCVVGAYRLDGCVVVDARAFGDGVELADGVGEDIGESFGLLRLDGLGGLRTGRGPGIGPADHVGQGEALDEEGQEGRAGDHEDDEVALGVGGAVEGGRDGQRHRQ